jgi:hypothetical protein
MLWHVYLIYSLNFQFSFASHSFLSATPVFYLICLSAGSRCHAVLQLVHLIPNFHNFFLHLLVYQSFLNAYFNPPSLLSISLPKFASVECNCVPAVSYHKFVTILCEDLSCLDLTTCMFPLGTSYLLQWIHGLHLIPLLRLASFFLLSLQLSGMISFLHQFRVAAPTYAIRKINTTKSNKNVVNLKILNRLWLKRILAIKGHPVTVKYLGRVHRESGGQFFLWGPGVNSL